MFMCKGPNDIDLRLTAKLYVNRRRGSSNSFTISSDSWHKLGNLNTATGRGVEVRRATTDAVAMNQADLNAIECLRRQITEIEKGRHARLHAAFEAAEIVPVEEIVAMADKNE